MGNLPCFRLDTTRFSVAKGEPMPTLDEIREIVARVVSRYPVRRAYIFGSFSRGEQSKGSDVDVLIDRASGFTLLSQCGIKSELEDALGMRVDVVTRGALKESVRSNAERDELLAYVAA